MPPTITKGVKSKTTTPFLAGVFPERQLSQLLRCVSCELQWTTRKSVFEKMKHLKSCAKKNRLDDGLVQTLIQRELDCISAAAAKGKGRANEQGSTLR